MTFVKDEERPFRDRRADETDAEDDDVPQEGDAPDGEDSEGGEGGNERGVPPEPPRRAEVRETPRS